MQSQPLGRRHVRDAFCLLLVCLVAPAASAKDLYVSPSGSDENPGTEVRPFATLARARDAIRVLKAGGGIQEPVTVFVRQGAYALAQTLALGSEDSGAPAAPIVYRACENEKPVLLGGRNIVGFTAHRQAVLKADVSALGMENAGIRLLVFDGQRQELARYPNSNPQAVGGGDWAYVDGTRYSMYVDSPDEDGYHARNGSLDFWQRNIPRLTQTLNVKPADLRAWSHPERGEVSIFARFNWQHSLPKIESLDAATRQFARFEAECLLIEGPCAPAPIALPPPQVLPATPSRNPGETARFRPVPLLTRMHEHGYTITGCDGLPPAGMSNCPTGRALLVSALSQFDSIATRLMCAGECADSLRPPSARSGTLV